MAVFLDLSKAFDSISHNILLTKLERLGIRGTPKQWFESYLSNRKQYMELYKIKSQTASIKCGVPQGSILGPILFLVYVNDIFNASELDTFCFADDTTVTYSSPNTNDLYNTMNRELYRLSQWFKANRLKLNINKTKYIIFSPSSHVQPNDNSLTVENMTIERIGHHEQNKYFKFLGLYIDETLSWKYHINMLCKRIAHSNYLINKLKNLVPRRCLLTLYYSLVQCHINYGLLIWGSSTNVNRVHKMQKKSLRIINNKPYNYHTEPLFKCCKILKVQDQYIVNSTVFMYKLKHHKHPKSFDPLMHDYFGPRSRITRQNNNAIQKRARTKFSSLLPYHKLPMIWNSLSVNLTSSEKLNNLKKLLITDILDNYAENIKCNNTYCRQCF